MTNRLFDTNIETLQYLGYITHDEHGTLTDTARIVCARLSVENIALSSFGVMCGAFAGKYWNAAKQMTSGTTADGQPYHERRINGEQVLIQRNRLGIWWCYVCQVSKSYFESEQQAIDWLTEYPLSDLS